MCGRILDGKVRMELPGCGELLPAKLLLRLAGVIVYNDSSCSDELGWVGISGSGFSCRSAYKLEVGEDWEQP